MKVTFAGNGLADYPDIRRITIPKVGQDHVRELIFSPIGTIGGGLNSGFQALNLAVQFGASRIVLIGFDMTTRSGVHWYGRNNWPMSSNPDDQQMKRWIACFNAAAPVLRNLGIEVVNTSINSALKCFPHRSIDEVVQGWS